MERMYSLQQQIIKRSSTKKCSKKYHSFPDKIVMGYWMTMKNILLSEEI